MPHRKIDLLLEEYGESHQNKTNKKIHWVCVPVIVWCVLALISEIPFPVSIYGINWLSIILILVIAYYFFLSKSLTIGFILISALSYWSISVYNNNFSLPLWLFALGLFVLAWIGQFWGHKIEGKKPSFFKDIQFLMIGPAWLLSFIYKRLGINY
ncbi:MAG: Mpo1-like protein [Cocleimonas sp.]